MIGQNEQRACVSILEFLLRVACFFFLFFFFFYENGVNAAYCVYML